MISRDLGHAFHGIAGSHFSKYQTVQARLIVCLQLCFRVECFGIFTRGRVHDLIFSSHTVSIAIDAMGVVDDPVENGFGDCGSPIMSCQPEAGSCAVMMVERR